ncbi:hypothetical protein VaNZ11_010576 [Volvox africanus]|uniref:FAS1 domain-containing protein n=1 Tax=Volvox africanus TaxID=51714 RepID=A0ABQ5SAL4_9CHLO|nr:hypothetical protein VaNZ11_010576 [Volvox africanus]
MRHPTVVFLIGLCIFSPAVYADSVLKTLDDTRVATFSTLALSMAGLNDTFSDPSLNITFFAPSDAAFLGVLGILNLSLIDLSGNARAMAPMLLYHAIKPATNASGFIAAGPTSWPNAFGGNVPVTVIPSSDGKTITVRSPGADASVTTANVAAGGSVIHVIDNVLLPFYPSASAVIARDPSLTTLFKVVSQNAPDLLLDSRLNITAEVTVFAPMNEAFITPLSTGSSLLRGLQTTRLGVTYLLKYHIVPKTATQGVIFNLSLDGIKTVTTLTGLTLKLSSKNGKPAVDFPGGTAYITQSYPVGFNVDASFRAVVHIIDQVLIPPSTLVDVATIKADGKKFVSALNASSTYSSLPNNSNFQGTILIPKDAAFSAFLTANNITFEQLAKAPTAMKQVLDAHVIRDKVFSLSAAIDGTQLTTASGSKINVAVDGAGVVIFKSGTVSAMAESEYVVASPVNGTTVIYINAVLFAGTLNVTTGGGTDGGGATSVGPSPFAMLLCSTLAAALLHLFGRF